MSTPFLGQIATFSFGYAPKGWALCNGQLLAINQNQALFSLLGTTYGGNGTQNFALPNLQGRAPVHFGNGFGLGGFGGEDVHTVQIDEIPSHTHVMSAVSSPGNEESAQGNIPAAVEADAYGTGAPTTTLGNGMAAAGQSQPHENRQPYLTLNFCIALSGIFPSQN